MTGSGSTIILSAGVLNLNQIERVQSVEPFFAMNGTSCKLDLVIGGRWDWLNYQVKDGFKTDGNQSGSRTVSQASSSVGWCITSLNNSRFIHVASVFEAPTTTELLNNPAGAADSIPT